MNMARDRNIFGAFALMVADDIVRAASAQAPDAGPAASALALLGHDPGMSVRTLAKGVGLSHAGAVRLVDRLVADGLIERRGHATDGRTVALHLSAEGEVRSAAVLAARSAVLAETLSALSEDEQAVLGRLSERVVRARLRDLDHAYTICRLCEYGACDHCPVDEELALTR
jgi:DNA-binding MarR family transcriptional regulator